MSTITKFFCICGADKPEDCKQYDGGLGYEALICKRCGRMYDHVGEYPADEFSCQHVGITKEQAAKYSTEALVEERKALIELVRADADKKLVIEAVAKNKKLIDTMRLTSGNLRDLATTLGRGHNAYSAMQQLAERLYNATV